MGIVERLLMDLAPLAEPAWLVIDEVHELGPDAFTSWARTRCGSWSY